MKLGRLYPYFLLLGCVLLGLGSFLPLWGKNGVTVNAWEGDYLSIGRWVLVLVVLAAVLIGLIPAWRKPKWLGMAGLIGLMQASLIVWRGYKLHAIGSGGWLLLAGALLILVAAVLLGMKVKE